MNDQDDLVNRIAVEPSSQQAECATGQQLMTRRAFTLRLARLAVIVPGVATGTQGVWLLTWKARFKDDPTVLNHRVSKPDQWPMTHKVIANMTPQPEERCITVEPSSQQAECATEQQLMTRRAFTLRLARLAVVVAVVAGVSLQAPKAFGY